MDNKGISDGLWRGEKKRIGPQARHADLWMLLCEEVRRNHQEENTTRSRAAVSASCWTSPAKWKERDWWSVDLEGEMEKLEVEGGTEGGSVDPEGKVEHWSARMKTTKEGSERS